MIPNEARNIVKQLFTDYLKANKLRRTPERIAILNTIYSINGHFDTDTLWDIMLNREKFRVSRATLYNTVNLLLEANLVIRHQFGGKAQYEKSYNTEPHHHLICTVCGKVSELHNEKMRATIMTMPSKRFSVSSYSLYLYGTCQKCQNAMKKKKQKQRIIQSKK